MRGRRRLRQWHTVHLVCQGYPVTESQLPFVGPPASGQVEGREAVAAVRQDAGASWMSARRQTMTRPGVAVATGQRMSGRFWSASKSPPHAAKQTT